MLLSQKFKIIKVSSIYPIKSPLSITPIVKFKHSPNTLVAQTINGDVIASMLAAATGWDGGRHVDSQVSRQHCLRARGKLFDSFLRGDCWDLWDSPSIPQNLCKRIIPITHQFLFHWKVRFIWLFLWLTGFIILWVNQIFPVGQMVKEQMSNFLSCTIPMYRIILNVRSWDATTIFGL